MIAILVSFCTALLGALLLTPLYIKWLVKRQFGQFIRQDGPTSHQTKRGTPTMGGVVIIGATTVSCLLGCLAIGHMPRISLLLLLFLMVGLGIVGFLDDYIKISRQRSLGLTPSAKIIGQLIVGSIFGVLALCYKGAVGSPAASPSISFVRDSYLSFALFGGILALLVFVLWSNFLISAWSNAVNLTDGLDGLATGTSIIAFGAYTLISIWQLNQSCQLKGALVRACYNVRDPLDNAIFAAAVVGACLGFLWWNASPAQIFMGDTGALALGGGFAGITIFTHTQVIGVLIGGLFVAVVMSDVIQIGYFKLTRKRVFLMAPLHHHFELKGWQEITIVIRFWLIAVLCVVAGLGLFYAEWISRAG